MARRIVVLSSFLLALAGCGVEPGERSAMAGLNEPRSSLAAEAAVIRSERPIPGQYVVVLRAGRDPAADARALVPAGGQVLHVYRTALRGFAARMSDAAASALARNPNVAWVEEDGIVEAVGTQASPPWGLDRIDQRALPVDHTYTYPTTAAGVDAYVIDTGIYAAHTDFSGRVTGGYDFVDHHAAPTDDCYGHGTHVAGILGGNTYGVAKEVRLHPVRVLDCNGSGAYSDVIAGVDWVTVDASGKHAVANMSLGGPGFSSLDEAVTNSIATGVTYAVAAGNEHQDACRSSPARTPNALTVGATTSSDAVASYSNFGSCVDLFAPGSSIESTYKNGGTATMSGTSMASPHVAGAAALYLGANPNAAPGDVANALVGNATSGALSGVRAGTVNLLLYVGAPDGGGGGGDVPAVTPAPTFDPPPGSYSKSVTVTIKDTDSNATIYYTTDGSTPTLAPPSTTVSCSAPCVLSPFTASTTLKAMAKASGLEPSTVISGRYNIRRK